MPGNLTTKEHEMISKAKAIKMLEKCEDESFIFFVISKEDIKERFNQFCADHDPPVVMEFVEEGLTSGGYDYVIDKLEGMLTGFDQRCNETMDEIFEEFYEDR
jgi:hypothetical protein